MADSASHLALDLALEVLHAEPEPDVGLICVSDVIDDMARHIGDFIQRMAPSPDTSRHVEPKNGV